MSEYRTTPRPVSGWAVGAYAFAAVIMILVGVFQAIAGIAAIAEDEFFVVTPNYVFEGDATGWGWVHLILGIVLVLAGFGLFAARTWARTVGVTLAGLSAVANFFFIPYYPFWAILIIALDVWVIWALTRPVEREA
jgi:uncharacterized membrane protein